MKIKNTFHYPPNQPKKLAIRNINRKNLYFQFPQKYQIFYQPPRNMLSWQENHPLEKQVRSFTKQPRLHL